MRTLCSSSLSFEFEPHTNSLNPNRYVLAQLAYHAKTESYMLSPEEEQKFDDVYTAKFLPRLFAKANDDVISIL